MSRAIQFIGGSHGVQDEGVDLSGGKGTVDFVGTGVTATTSGDKTTVTISPGGGAHAGAHQDGGADEVATATPAANVIPKAGADGTLAPGFLPPAITFGEVDQGTKNGAFAITWADGQKHTVVLDGNAAPSFVNPPGSGSFRLLVIQDGAGGHSWTHPAGTRTSGSTTPPEFSTGANEETIFTYDFNALSSKYTVLSAANLQVIA